MLVRVRRASAVSDGVDSTWAGCFTVFGVSLSPPCS